MEDSSNRTIAKNTVFLYLRMALVTIVGLYTSRVVLQQLGVDNYGIYTVAGSAVAIFGFITGALGQSSSRYITVEIGKVIGEDISSLVRCFKTTRTIHGILAIIIAIACETIGLWVLNKSAIPIERQNAAFWVFQISVVTALINITQVPFNALIIAHEKMGVFAYISIFEVFAKLFICYLLVISPIDRLVFYALLYFLVHVVVFLFYRVYCHRSFKECNLGYSLDKEFFRPIMTFSFWNLFGSLSYSALTQGTTIIISFFFGPVVVASRAIANQVKNYVTNFVTNFRLAINPQILKRNAAGEVNSSRSLLFLSANITFYLMLILILPLFFCAKFILSIWLVEVPEYTEEFMQIAMIEMLFYCYDITFFQIFQTEGRLKENAIICPLMDLLGLFIVYLYYLRGGNVLAIAWCMVLLTLLQGCFVKPYLAIRLFNYKWKDFLDVFYNNLKVFIVSIIVPIILYLSLEDVFYKYVILLIVSFISSFLSSFYIGFSKESRIKMIGLVKTKLKRKNAF